MVRNRGIYSFRGTSPRFRAVTVRRSLNEKPDRSAHMRIVVRLGLASLNHIKPRNIGSRW
jgi:hypothetical protein